MPTQDPYLQQINALRELSVEAYEEASDPLIATLQAAGVFSQYEMLILEIDNSFDDEFFKKANEVMDLHINFDDK